MAATRFVAPLLSSLAIVLVATASIIAVLFDKQDVNLQQLHASAQQSDFPAQPKPIDVTSFMQGAKIQLDRLSLQDNDSVKDDHGMHTPSSDNQVMSPKTALGGQDVKSRMVNEIKMLASSLRTNMWSAYMHSSTRLKTKSGSTAVVLISILLGCTCLAISTMIFPDKFGFHRREREQSFVSTGSPMGSNTSLQPQQPRLSQEWGAGVFRSSPVRTSQGPQARTGFTSPHTSALAPSPLMSGFSLSGPISMSGPVSRTPITNQSKTVPPLCPTIVMPLVEARFGIPLLEINKMMKSGAGELVIVGLSTNPLLRAVVKRVGNGNARSLEITMPERNGVPRATLTPTAQGASEGATTLEIRGMRNSFYGYLVMTEQATYVTNDGQTVLSIGGEAASLQLLLKAGDGSKVADVRCSSEAFGGSDHVEIRVEPGIDTVLVLAVVLSVLLLSPWSASP